MINDFLLIEYVVRKRNSDNWLDKYDSAEELNAASVLRARHLSGIFALLQTVDVSRWNGSDEDLSNALNHVGQLGHALAEGLFGEVDTLYGLHRQTKHELESATTFLES